MSEPKSAFAKFTPPFSADRVFGHQHHHPSIYQVCTPGLIFAVPALSSHLVDLQGPETLRMGEHRAARGASVSLGHKFGNSTGIHGLPNTEREPSNPAPAAERRPGVGPQVLGLGWASGGG